MSSDLLDELRQQAPDAARVAQIQSKLTGTLRPVAPLPSERILVLLLTACFLVLVILCGAALGLRGFQSLNGLQRVTYGGTIVFAAWSAAAATQAQMIPGGRQRVPLGLQIALPLVLIALVVLVLFPDFSTNRFVRQGIPCLRVGLACAVPSGLLLTLAMRRGFVTNKLTAATASGAFAGLAGVGVLAMHCPILNSAHILVWHLGTILISIAAGALVGWFAEI